MIRKFLDFLTQSNLWLAAAAASLTFVVITLTGIKQDAIAVLVPALLFFSIYSFERKIDMEANMINDPNRTLFVKRHYKKMYIFATIAYIVALLLAYEKSFIAFLISLIPIIGMVLYDVKLIPKRLNVKYRRFKDIPLGKNVVISLVVSTTIVLFPYFYISSFSFQLALMLWTFIFFRVFINSIAFDIGDVEGDRKEKIKTLPILLGVDKVRKLLSTLNFMVMIIFALATLIGILPNTMHIVNLFFWAYAQHYIRKCDKMHPDIQNFVIDGENIFVAVLLWLYILMTI